MAGSVSGIGVVSSGFVGVVGPGAWVVGASVGFSVGFVWQAARPSTSKNASIDANTFFIVFLL